MRYLVVYRTIPTSNHNLQGLDSITLQLYIVLFLHQTTTGCFLRLLASCCISYYSYIKPQPITNANANAGCCISYYSYIKPQPNYYLCKINSVVYRTIPTSNHNWLRHQSCVRELYIVLFLHQTTTCQCCDISARCCISYYSYIKPQPIMLIQLIISILLSLSLIRNSQVGSKTIQKY